MAPPRLFAELFVKLVVATVVGRDSTRIAPPLPVLNAWLFEKAVVPKDAFPEPIPPGDANARMYRSAPAPPAPNPVLRLNVDPVTVKNPVPPVCFGEDGEKLTPPPLAPD